MTMRGEYIQTGISFLGELLLLRSPSLTDGVPSFSDMFIDSREVLKLDLILGHTNLEYCGASFRVYILYRGLFQQSVAIKLT